MTTFFRSKNGFNQAPLDQSSDVGLGVRCFKVPLILSLVLLGISFAEAEWTIDWSRRQNAFQPKAADSRPSGWGVAHEQGSPSGPRGITTEIQNSSGATEASFLDRVLEAGAPVQDVIILHTAKGFVPNVIRVRKDGRYRFHVVNVNATEKNASFILDGFSENHATSFGQPKSFLVEPKRMGAYSYMSPETGIEGQLIVVGQEPVEPPPVKARLPAQAKAQTDSVDQTDLSPQGVAQP